MKIAQAEPKSVAYCDPGINEHQNGTALTGKAEEDSGGTHVDSEREETNKIRTGSRSIDPHEKDEGEADEAPAYISHPGLLTPVYPSVVGRHEDHANANSEHGLGELTVVRTRLLCGPPGEKRPRSVWFRQRRHGVQL